MAQDRYERSSRADFDTSLRSSLSDVALRQSTKLEQRLDRLSSYFYENLKGQAKTEGQLYGIKTKPSREQIAVALNRGDDASTLFAEGGTIFGDAAREVQGEMYRQDLESEMLNFSSQTLQAMKTGALTIEDPNAFAEELESRIEGYATVLEKVSPTQAVKFKASQYTIGNKLYEKANDLLISRATAQAQASINQNIKDYEILLTNALLASDGSIIDAESIMMPAEGNIADLIKRVPDNYVDNVNTLRAAQQNAYKSALITYIDEMKSTFVPQGSDLFTELRKGNVGKFSDVYMGLLDADQRVELEKEIAESIARKNTLHEAQQTDLSNRNRLAKENILIEHASGKIGPEQAIRQIRALGLHLDKSLIDALSQPMQETEDTIINTADLKFKIQTGTANKEDILNAYKVRDITAKDYADMLNTYTTVTQNVNKGLREIKRGLGLPEITEWAKVDSVKKEKYDRYASKLVLQSQIALSKGELFDDYAFAQELLKEVATDDIESGINDRILTLQTYFPNITRENVLDLDTNGNGELDQDELDSIEGTSKKTDAQNAFKYLYKNLRK
jgi:hypothetical protein